MCCFVDVKSRLATLRENGTTTTAAATATATATTAAAAAAADKPDDIWSIWFGMYFLRQRRLRDVVSMTISIICVEEELGGHVVVGSGS